MNKTSKYDLWQIKSIALGLLIYVIVVPSAQADEVCSVNLREKLYQEAFQTCLEAAKIGDISAQSNVAYLYLKGKGVKPNYNQAAFWFSQAAKENIAYAQYNLGLMYLKGQGVAPDIEQGRQWLQKASAQGYKKATDALAEFDNQAIPPSNPDVPDQQVFRTLNPQKNPIMPQSQAPVPGFQQQAPQPQVVQRKAVVQYQPTEIGNACRNNIRAQNYRQALLDCRTAGEQGDAVGQFYVAEILRRGKGIAQNPTEAIRWYMASAQNGVSESQYQLATMYHEGIGTAQDLETAKSWYQQAAERGHQKARQQLFLVHKAMQDKQMPNQPQQATVPQSARQPSIPAQTQVTTELMGGKAQKLYELALATMSQGGNAQTQKEAFILVKEAAKEGYPPAQYKLATFYETGTGVEQNMREAITWYQSAANKGFAPAQNRLGEIYQEGSGAGIPQNLSIAVAWYQKAAQQGHVETYYNLARLYESGSGLGQDYQKAMNWYLKAAEKNHAPSQFALGNMYATGSGVPVNIPEAQKWYSLAALTYPPAQQALEVIAQNQQPVQQRLPEPTQQDFTAGPAPQMTQPERPQSQQEVFNRYMQAAQQNDPQAQIEIGKFYQYGKLGNVEYEQAVFWYQKAAEQNHPEGWYRLGIAYEKGLGITKNIPLAAKSYYQAAQKSHTKSVHRLGALYLQAKKYEQATRWIDEVTKLIEREDCPSGMSAQGSMSPDSC